MNISRNHRTGAVVTATAVAVAVTGALSFGRSDTPELVIARPAAAVGTDGNSIRGPGIPPAPGSTQNAPPDPNPGAPTPNIKKVANALHLTNKSVTLVLTVPAGLGLTNRVDVSVGYGTEGKHLTQAYNNESGNRMAVNLPEGDGQRRREEVVVTLAELTIDGTFARYPIKSTVDLEPLYTFTLSPLTFTLQGDCDEVGETEPLVRWRSADGQTGGLSFSASGFDTYRIGRFARTIRAVGASAGLKEPTFAFSEQDSDPFGFGKPPRPPDDLSVTLQVGKSRTVAFLKNAQNDQFCSAKFSYQIGWKLSLFS